MPKEQKTTATHFFYDVVIFRLSIAPGALRFNRNFPAAFLKEAARAAPQTRSQGFLSFQNERISGKKMNRKPTRKPLKNVLGMEALFIAALDMGYMADGWRTENGEKRHSMETEI
jgi:hypothetical protein